MSKTKSNSLVLIAINMLNDPKLGFRREMLDKLGLKKDVNFIDGTYATIEKKEINGKHVDIVALSPKQEELALIEVKASCFEPLQPSQAKGGEYEKVAKKYGIKLFYFVPQEYAHLDDLPNCSKVITWEEILFMESVKGTSFANSVRELAELNIQSGSSLAKSLSIFSSSLTKILSDENLFEEPSSFFTDTIGEDVTWYDIASDDDGKEEISIGVCTENGNIYLYVLSEGKKLLNATDWKNFGTLYHPTPKSFYNKMFNLVEDVDEDDLSLGTDFMDNFKNKIKKIAAIAKKVL